MKVGRVSCGMCHRPLFFLGWLDLGTVVGIYICHYCDRRR